MEIKKLKHYIIIIYTETIGDFYYSYNYPYLEDDFLKIDTVDSKCIWVERNRIKQINIDPVFEIGVK
jgi:hypothetical protein